MDVLDHAETDSESDFTTLMRTHLITTARWGKFLAILGFVGIGLVIVLAIAVAADFSQQIQSSKEEYEMIGVFTMYAVFAAAGLIPMIYLMKFSTGILKNVYAFDRSAMEQALWNLKSAAKYIGILAIIIVVFHVLLVGLVAFGTELF